LRFGLTRFGVLRAQKPPLTRMQNYFSVGVDAEVSRRFDTARSANPERFRSQMSNKIKYGACLNSGYIFPSISDALVTYRSYDGRELGVQRRGELGKARVVAAHRRR
jgi:hypothetical protein